MTDFKLKKINTAMGKTINLAAVRMYLASLWKNCSFQVLNSPSKKPKI